MSDTDSDCDFSLPKWSIGTNFDKPFTCALIGSTKSGKTTFLNYLLPRIYMKYDLICFFSTNNHAQVYKEIMDLPNIISFDKFRPEVVKDLFAYQKRSDNEFNFLILIDDEVDSKNSATIKRLFSVLRNSNFSTIYSGQDYTFIAKSNRNNLNYLFLFKQNNIEKYGDIHKMFFKSLIFPLVCPKSKEKRKYIKDEVEIDFIKKNTLNHNILVLDIMNDYKLYSFKVKI